MKRPGTSVIEVIIAIGLAAVVIAAIGNLIGATHRLTTASGKEIQAAAYAKEWIELVSVPVTTQSMFGCTCDTLGACPGGSPNICTIGTQTCRADSRPGFSSCWVEAPMDVGSFIFSGSGPWTMTESLASGFTRTMTISNPSADFNVKKVLVEVSWQSGSTTRQTELSTFLTAWKDFP